MRRRLLIIVAVIGLGVGFAAAGSVWPLLSFGIILVAQLIRLATDHRQGKPELPIWPSKDPADY